MTVRFCSLTWITRINCFYRYVKVSYQVVELGTDVNSVKVVTPLNIPMIPFALICIHWYLAINFWKSIVSSTLCAYHEVVNSGLKMFLTNVKHLLFWLERAAFPHSYKIYDSYCILVQGNIHPCSFSLLSPLFSVGRFKTGQIQLSHF